MERFFHSPRTNKHHKMQTLWIEQGNYMPPHLGQRAQISHRASGLTRVVVNPLCFLINNLFCNQVHNTLWLGAVGQPSGKDRAPKDIAVVNNSHPHRWYITHRCGWEDVRLRSENRTLTVNALGGYLHICRPMFYFFCTVLSTIGFHLKTFIWKACPYGATSGC